MLVAISHMVNGKIQLNLLFSSVLVLSTTFLQFHSYLCGSDSPNAQESFTMIQRQIRNKLLILANTLFQWWFKQLEFLELKLEALRHTTSSLL